MKQSSNNIIRCLGLAFALSSQGLLANLVTENASVQKLSPLPEHASTTRNIVDALASRHYVTATLNDQLSSRIFDAYLKDLDPTKSYLLQSDVDQFARVYRYSFDNDLRRGDLGAAFKIFNRYHQRTIDRFKKNLKVLDAGIGQFDFTKDEYLPLDREDAPWAKTQAELDDLWRRRLKHSVLNLKLTDKEDEKITELMLKRYRNRLVRTKQTNSEDVYQLFMNSFTNTYDPHTQYFSPRTSENFNINMSLSLEGIGAVLQREDEYTKVVSLVPAGPADKSKRLFPDDRIIAVGQGVKGDMVDVVGWRLDEVVQLIRGKKDTIVKLDVIAAENKDSAESKIIHIRRNTVRLEEQSAQSDIIEFEQFGHTHKIGIVDIPTFYIDFRALQRGDKNYKSTTRDVRELLVDLIEQGVEGIIIDLRDNGGGSLQEANFVTGLFIDHGPTVQIRNKSNRVNILTDRDNRTVYDGPLAILVNRLSASASEIFAGAIQDYQRGLVIGSQTFGKGTVQSLIPLNRGQLKITQAKFYRISGESTQHQGIIPDILYPVSYDNDSIGESSLDHPLTWDKIEPTAYRVKSNILAIIPELRSQHAVRVKSNADFVYLREAFNFRKRQTEENEISLNQQTREKKQQSVDDFWLTLENDRRIAKGLEPVASLDDLNKENLVVASNAEASAETTAAEDSSTDDLDGNELAGVTSPLAEQPGAETAQEPIAAEPEEKPDAYLLETSNILLDLISMTNRTAAKKSVRQSI